jgi:hypothetical protein
MQTKILQGLPFLVNPETRQIFAYEKPLSAHPLLLGTYDPQSEKIALRADWRDVYAPGLAAYRAAEKPRQRQKRG